MSEQDILQLPDDILDLILHGGSGTLSDAADHAAARLVCRAWRDVVDRRMPGRLQPASVPCAAVAAAFSTIKDLDLCRLHRKSPDEVAAQLQQLPFALPALTSLRLGGLWQALRIREGMRAVAQLPKLARLTLAGSPSDDVLQQVSALVPLASTLTFLDLSEVHRWSKLRRHFPPAGLKFPRAMPEFKRLHTLILGMEVVPGPTLAALPTSLQRLQLRGDHRCATGLTPFTCPNLLTALTLAVQLCTMPLSDWAAIGQLSRLRRLELSPEKDVHLDAECRSADAGQAVMLEPLTALTALAMSGCTAADLPRHLSCQSRLSQLRSLTVRSANMQVLLLPPRTQLQRLTRLDLLEVRLQSGEQAALQQICQLSTLQSLQLGYSNILSSFSSGCRLISSSLTNLRQLGIAASSLQNTNSQRQGIVGGLQNLATLPELKRLDMSGRTNSFPSGCSMPQLTALDISGASYFMYKGTSPAECCPNLRELRVNVWSRGSSPHNDIQIAWHALAGMSRLSQLSVLHVENIQVLGARAFSELQAVIATSPALRFLNINGDAGKTGGLARLYLMKTLRVLRCRGTENVRTRLFAAHPYLRVFDCEHDRWKQPPLLGDDSNEG